jgi:hypothetical protein
MIDIEEEAEAIYELATLVGVLTAGGDADTAIKGISLIMIDIRNRAADIKGRYANIKQSIEANI